MMFAEGNDNKQHLNMHLDQSLAHKSSSKEGPERNQRVATDDTGKIKERVRDRGKDKDTKEPNLGYKLFSPKLGSVDQTLKQ